MIILSEFHSDDSYRQALVYKEDGKYFVRQMEDGSVIYTRYFDSEDVAEIFAEDWVMRVNTND